MCDLGQNLADLEAVAESESPYYSEGLRAAWVRHYVKGYTGGVAKVVVTVLETRGVALRADERERVLGCTDPAQLSAWVRCVCEVESSAELFG